ncbi:hypothetical protein M752DRAFT_320651 [Aspergillus phoenicis ATCC 13157]|uniref:Amino acid transporter transmembrane domain-containing protein n=1 Tax=Aspergillus phoenicis ATCC 13157 TaxID=1353007 RepID=A0A370PC11_ASPPH|nr:hypothetical protein M752DRAFT_320651 [Aspergillus phoenicis ATCC 13157]
MSPLSEINNPGDPLAEQEKPVGARNTSGTGDPFSHDGVGGVKYRTLAWCIPNRSPLTACTVMVAETISLGILSLPSAVASLGLVAAVILILGLGALATYTGYTLGQFKLRYPHVHSMGDAGEVLMGRIGREVLGTAQLLFLIFIMGSHLLTFTVMMNTLTDHGTCSIVFGVIGLAVSFAFTLPRTLKKVSWLSISCRSQVAAVLMPSLTTHSTKLSWLSLTLSSHTVYDKTFLSRETKLTSTAGHVAFFGFISEMRTPTDYPKTLYMLQGIDTSMYTISAVVIYRYGGRDVASPALGSTSPLMSKIAYGIAIPTIVIAGVINGHVACKYIYVRLFRGTDRMHQRGLVSIGTWVMIGLVLWTLAWIIAEAIPVFNDLLSLITALFASWFTYGLSGIFWLFLNWGRYSSSRRKILLTGLNLLVVVVGGCLCALGLYVSGKSIHDHPRSSSFSCANNA